MPTQRPSSPKEEMQQIIDSARRLGVEMDEGEALQWLTAMAARGEDEIVFREGSGVFGHAITMLDFSDADLAHFRAIGRLVEFADEPGVETALALSGSAAQSKIQTYPGDCDFFERINIHAATREAACQILARLIRDKALATTEGPSYRLMEVRFGQYAEDLIRDGKLRPAGSSISWSPDEVREEQFKAETIDGRPRTITWQAVAQEPGWCKLDWIIADAIRGHLANASNMIDATWEAPDGSIAPLDGYLDPYFQEVYLDAESVPIFAKLARHVSPDALRDYVAQLEGEVAKYVRDEINYGKAAKRMYNIFRYTGWYAEAAFVRELFDEPATILYQIWSLIRALDEALLPGAGMELAELDEQIDALILSVTDTLEGDEEREIVRRLLRLRRALDNKSSLSRAAEVGAARDAIINVVNNFFYEKLTAVPTIKAYIDRLRTTGDE